MDFSIGSIMSLVVYKKLVNSILNSRECYIITLVITH